MESSRPETRVQSIVLVVMTVQMTAADEVQALVLEIGSATTRIGYSGDDMPQAIFPTIVSSDESRVGLSLPHLDYVRPLSLTGRVVGESDASGTQAVMSSAFNRLRVSPSDYPLLFIDSPLQPDTLEKSRQAILQLAFEHFNIPAVYFGKSSVMAMFSMGRHTGLVLEIGAAGSSVVPVFEGIPLNSGISTSPVGGNFIDEQCDALLRSSPYYEQLILPQECIKERKVVGLGEPPKYTFVPDVQMSESFRQLKHHEIIRDFKESVVQIAESVNVAEKDLALRPPRYYEFPSGYNKNYGAERYALGECIFTGGSSSDAGPMFGCIDLIKESLSKLSGEKADGHYHHQLSQTLVVSGGTTLTSGFMDRLNLDLQTRLPLLGKMRVQAAATPMERRLSPWLGGSALASLGTMQAFWLTRAEYAEHGSSILGKKFP